MNKGSNSALAHIASIVAGSNGNSPSQPEEPFIFDTPVDPIDYQRLKDQNARLKNLASRAREAEKEIYSARSSNDNVTVKASSRNDSKAVQNQAVTTEEDDLSSLGILFGFLTVFLVFVISVGMALSYLSYSFQAKVDYDDVIARSYKANEAIRERDNQLDLLLNSLKNQERKASTEKEFVPSTDLQNVLTARDEYKNLQVTDFAAFNAANKAYLRELSNYLATHKQDSSVYYYAKSSNLNALIELDNYNHYIVAYRNRFNSKVYTWIANKNKGHEDYLKVVPLDTTNYLSD